MAIIGAPTTRAHIANLLERNLRRWFLHDAHRFEKEALYPRLYNMETSDMKIERHAVVAGYGTYYPKSEGDVPNYDSGQEAWRNSYTHSTYCLGAEFTKEAIEDDIHGIIKRLAKVGGALASVARYTKERDAINLFNNYWTSGTVFTAGGTGYPILSDSHYRVDGGTWDNYLGSMDLSVEALEYAVSHWVTNQVNQRGQVMMTRPSLLLIGAQDWALARRILGTRDRRPQSADNDINPITDYDIQDLMHPLFSTDGRWGLFAPNDPDYGFYYYDRIKPNVERWGDGDNGNIKMVGRYRESHGADHMTGVLGAS